jgi:hypothetical protein
MTFLQRYILFNLIIVIISGIVVGCILLPVAFWILVGLVSCVAGTFVLFLLWEACLYAYHKLITI